MMPSFARVVAPYLAHKRRKFTMGLERPVRGLGRVRRLRTLEFRKRPALDLADRP